MMAQAMLILRLRLILMPMPMPTPTPMLMLMPLLLIPVLMLLLTLTLALALALMPVSLGRLERSMLTMAALSSGSTLDGQANLPWQLQRYIESSCLLPFYTTRYQARPTEPGSTSVGTHATDT